MNIYQEISKEKDRDRIVELVRLQAELDGASGDLQDTYCVGYLASVLSEKNDATL